MSLSLWIGRDEIAIVLRGDRGLEQFFLCLSQLRMSIAIVLRGDRGLERLMISGVGTSSRLRSFFGAIEDWNYTDRL